MTEGVGRRIVTLMRARGELQDKSAARDSADKLNSAHDAERAAKKFYDEFRRRRLDFLEQLGGARDEEERAARASVLLNRLMFVYFLQSGGFIKGHAARADYRYLQNGLRRSRARGEGRYHAEFLRTLFFEGFAKPENARAPRAKRLVGVVPYLGGLFVGRAAEERPPAVAVPDAAFEKLFSFFDRYSWNLDDAPTGRADEINPDILGYVFERHINRKALGAYYTRAEITRHLCEQTIHSLILDRVNAVRNDERGTLNDELKSSRLQFIVHRLNFRVRETRPLPQAVLTAGPQHSLAPRRFDSMSDLLSNLDAALCRFLLDKVLPDLKLLDPACGSGAFLLAALKALVSIYAAVIGRASAVGDAGLKRRLATQRREHTSLDFYVRRRVVTDNLFGVDIMGEATEVARLRLLLALVASAERAEQLELLPDVNSNILAGNSLVGLLHARETTDDTALRAFAPLREARRFAQRRKGAKERFCNGLLTPSRDNAGKKRRVAAATPDEMLLDQFRESGIDRKSTRLNSSH